MSNPVCKGIVLAGFCGDIKAIFRYIENAARTAGGCLRKPMTCIRCETKKQSDSDSTDRREYNPSVSFLQGHIL
jgi:hypothetical protein